MLKTVGDLKKVIADLPDDMPLRGQWLNATIAETFKVEWAQVCTWRDSQVRDYLTDALKGKVEKDSPPPYHWKKLRRPVFVMDFRDM